MPPPAVAGLQSLSYMIPGGHYLQYPGYYPGYPPSNLHLPPQSAHYSYPPPQQGHDRDRDREREGEGEGQITSERSRQGER